MRILVIGGTRFAGRHLVGMAIERGHDVTLFNRGVSAPEAFPNVEQIHGDRDGGLEPLRGREFDAVVDMCGYVPRVVRQSVRLLEGHAGHYTFVSSMSVYVHDVPAGFDESAPLRTLADPSVEEVTGETYGGLKALCEREVELGFGGRAVVARPGLVVGPFDPTDRFTYWPRRVAEGGEVLAPAPAERPVQFVDGRDLAAWMLSMAERGAAGTFNAVCPPLSMDELLEAGRRAVGSDGTVAWVDESFLLEEGVEPWTGLPLWIPGAAGAATLTGDSRKAISEGLAFRPAEETVLDTLAWDLDRRPDPERPMLAGITRQRERELLERWRPAGG